MKNKLTPEHILTWFGNDEKEDIANYLASILNDLAEEGTSPIALNLHEEIFNYEIEE